jgi:hypothetical protein
MRLLHCGIPSWTKRRENSGKESEKVANINETSTSSKMFPFFFLIVPERRAASGETLTSKLLETDSKHKFAP